MVVGRKLDWVILCVDMEKPVIGPARHAQHELLVSCIMPTCNRRRFVPQAITYFLRQDFPDRELIIVDDGDDCVADLVPQHPAIRYVSLTARQSVGAKRNRACEQARGAIILHWDDDDWMAPWRIRYQVKALLDSGADLCGLGQMLYYDPVAERAWLYRYPKRASVPLVAGGSLCYWRRIWEGSRFDEVSRGEDARFVWSRLSKHVHVLPEHRFYVAINHRGNTSPRRTEGRGWRRCAARQVHALLTGDLAFYQGVRLPQPGESGRSAIREASSSPMQPGEPLISCIMPTRDRRTFVRRSITYFLRQSYQNKELIIVDDGADNLADLVPTQGRIRYVRLRQRVSVGHKRNLALKQSNGEIVAHWDDDDWYADDRLAYQAGEILKGNGDICGLETGLIYDAQAGKFWSCTPALHARMFFADVHGRSIMYRREVWENCARYPDRSMGEDVHFLRRALAKHRTLSRLDNGGKLIYIRHGSNTWQFDCGEFLERGGWRPACTPGYLPRDDLRFYAQLARHGIEAAARRSEPSSEMPHRAGHGMPLPGCLRVEEAVQRNCCADTGSDRARLNGHHVTVSLPCYRCASTIRRAVHSILNQTHQALTLVVINDGDTSLGRMLSDIDDPRLIEFDLPVNRGRYFADAVVLEATQDDYFVIQDADDWSEPDRIERLLALIDESGALSAVSACQLWKWCRGKTVKYQVKRYTALAQPLTDAFEFRSDHHGVFRTQSLREIGGYYGGFRVAYDTFLINILLMVGAIAYTDKPLYNRLLRPGSLTSSRETGMTSAHRRRVRQELGAIYREALQVYQRHQTGSVGHQVMLSRIAHLLRRRVAAAAREEIHRHAQQLRARMLSAGSGVPEAAHAVAER